MTNGVVDRSTTCAPTSSAVGTGGGVVVTSGEDQKVRVYQVTCVGGHDCEGMGKQKSCGEGRKGSGSLGTSLQTSTDRQSEYTCLHTLQGHTAGVHCCWLSPSGLTVVSGSDDKTVRVWDVWRGVCTRIFSHSDPILSCGLSACGRWLYSCTVYQVHVCDWRQVDNTHVDNISHHTAVVQHPAARLEQISSLAMSDDGKLVYGTKEGQVYMGSIVIANRE